MRIKTKKVYYCDYCKKHSLRSLTTHEKHCTGNPNRECRLECDTVDLPGLIEKYKSQLITKNDTLGFLELVEKPSIKDIKNDTGHCPNCTLAIMRCAEIGYYYSKEEFDYKRELQSWWDMVNEIERQSDEQSAIYGI